MKDIKRGDMGEKSFALIIQQ